MKKSWNKVIIISFILLVLVAVGTVIFLLPYYNRYKVFDGIEAGHWEDAKDAYDSLNASQQEYVQDLLPDYAKYVYEQYTENKKDYAYTAAAYDAINSIDESGELVKPYMDSLNYLEYKKAIDATRNSSATYDNRGGYDAQNTIAGINKRIDNETRELILIEILNEKYLAFVKQQLTAGEVEAYCDIIATQAYFAAKDYIEVVKSNLACVNLYRELYTEAQQAYNEGDFFTTINICQNVILDPDDADYIDKYYSLYSLAYATGMNSYDDLLDYYIDIGDNKNAVKLIEKMDLYFGDDVNLAAKKLRLAKDWQKAYVKLAENYDKEIQNALSASSGEEEDGDEPQKVSLDIKADSLLLKDINDDGVPEAFFFDSTEGNSTYTSCYIFGFEGDKAVYLGKAKIRSFCKNNSLVIFPWRSARISGDEFGIMAYSDGVLSAGSDCQDIEGTYYVNGSEVDKVAYLSARSEILESSIDQGVDKFDSALIADSESYILAY